MLNTLNHAIEMLHNPPYVRAYTARHWRAVFAAHGLEVEACETRCREIPGGLTVGR